MGVGATIEVFGKLGRETGVKEFNALIGLCIEKARDAEDEDVAYEQFHRAYELFESMRERGLQVEEETYGPFLIYLIDIEKVDEFQFFCVKIKDENPNSHSRLAYYEMLLWVRVGNENEIQKLLNNIADDDDEHNYNFKEYYLVALCEGDRQKEVLQLLEDIDIAKVSSLDHVISIFRSLGRLSLESFAKKLILELKIDASEVEDLSKFIYYYAISMPNLAVEDVVLKFENLHAELKMIPSPIPYEKLIRTCCESLKVHVALDMVDKMFEEGLTVTISTFHSILSACYESCEYNLVHRIYAMICRHDLKPNNETFRSMISCCMKMKDFDGAYGMLKDLQKMNLMPTASMYNVIMGGYFREKNFYGGLKVLKQMDAANVKPDSQTFSYIIGNCNCEEDIVKYHKELKDSEVQMTKHVFMALINAYAACGLFEKAKQVALDKGVPGKSLNEVKSVLVSALASHGQMSDALVIYEEIKHVGADLEPKAIISLIEYFQSEGQVSRLRLLLEDLTDLDYWLDGCIRIILYCVRHKHLSPALDLLKQLMDKSSKNGVAVENLFDEVFCHFAEIESTDVQFGLDLLQAIKEDIGICPSRKSLDFLLSACVNAKDLQSSLRVWKEYKAAGLPYNVLSFLRMYQALLASGDHKSATKVLEKIPNDDCDVCSIIKACQTIYGASAFVERKKKKKKKKKF